MAAFLGGYQARDYEVVDYRMTELPGTGIEFRGPLPGSFEPGSYFAAVGAAQTFGCYCEHPYPAILAESIGLPPLNLGWAGPGPEWFLRNEALLGYMNRARFVVLQVMSGRSVSNSHYDSGGLAYVTRLRDGKRMSTDEFFEALLRGPEALRRLPLPPRLKRKLGNLAARPAAAALVRELRANWVRSSLELLRRIEVPVVLLWFSRRPPAYSERYATKGKLLGEFPHLITPEMLDPLRPRVAAYVECVTHRGSPHRLYSRFTGEPIVDHPEDPYYPSPEMHEDAAAALHATCLPFARG
jgi:Domain of unknown function (DUF6473)